MAAEARVPASQIAETVLEEATILAFKGRLRGELLHSGTSGYDAARAIWNARIDKNSALIARCAGAADVDAAVTFARDHQALQPIQMVRT